MSEKPASVVLVHEAFAESASWNPVIEHVAARCIGCVAIANPLRSVAVDAAYVRDVASMDGPVVLVGHSYSGIVITEAAAGNDSIVALVYVVAFAPQQGESAFQLSTMFPGSRLADALVAYPVSAGGTEFAIRREQFHTPFAADVPADQAALMGATQRPVTLAALSEGLPTAQPAWRDIPSWFVFGDQDLNIPAALHRFVAERAGSKGTRPVVGASHALSASHPDQVTTRILDALAVPS